MINTDKYEGHNTDDRIWHQYSEGLTSDYTDGRSRADEADALLVADAPLLLEEVKRLREVILDFSLPMWNYLNSQVHTDAEEYTAYAVKSLVKNTPYESLMHLWEDACDYLPDPDCDDVPSNRPVWSRSDGE